MSRKKTALPENLQAKLLEILNRRLADTITETMMLLSDVSLPEVDAEVLLTRFERPVEVRRSTVS